MTNVLLAIIVLLLTTFGIAGFVVLRGVRNEYRRIEDTIVEFLTPVETENEKGEKVKVSRLALGAEFVASMFARSVTAQIKTTFMGIQSGQARQAKALGDAVVEDVAAANPLANVLMAYPAVGKLIKKNPAVLDMVMNLAGSFVGQAQRGGSQTSGNGAEAPRFRL